MSGLKTGADTYDHLANLAKTPDPSLKTLGDRLADEAEAVFRQYRDAPPDEEVLYTQMIGKGLPDARTIAGANLNADEVVDRMLEALTLPEHCAPGMQELFRQVTVPVLAELLGNPAFFADVEPMAMAEVLRRQEEQTSAIDRLGNSLDKRENEEKERIADQSAQLAIQGFSYLSATISMEKHDPNEIAILLREMKLAGMEVQGLRELVRTVGGEQ